MTTYASFNRQNLAVLRSEMDAALNKFAANSGIEIKIGNMSFTSDNVAIKLEAKISGSKSMREQKLESALQLQSRIDQLTLEPINGKQLVGYNPRAHKMPYVYLELKTGKRFKTTRTAAKLYFTTPKSIARTLIAA
jgi:hypothetical protein